MFSYELKRGTLTVSLSGELDQRMAAMVRTELDKLLNMPIALHYVVEISDGVQSACYYKTTTGYKYEPFFNVKMALQNQMEREDGVVA